MAAGQDYLVLDRADGYNFALISHNALVFMQLVPHNSKLQFERHRVKMVYFLWHFIAQYLQNVDLELGWQNKQGINFMMFVFFTKDTVYLILNYYKMLLIFAYKTCTIKTN